MEHFVDHKPLISDKCSSSSNCFQKDHQITLHEAQLHVHCTYYSRRHFLLILIIYYNKDWSSLNQSLTLCAWLICFWYLDMIFICSPHRQKVQRTSYWRPSSNNLMKLDCQNGKHKSRIRSGLSKLLHKIIGKNDVEKKTQIKKT